jgi:hypothetical protein
MVDQNQLRADVAGWVMTFGDRVVPTTEWLDNPWYRNVCRTSARDMAHKGYLSDDGAFARGIAQKGLDFIRGE